MRKFHGMYLPAALLIVFLGMMLATCGGGGDGGNSSATLSGGSDLGTNPGALTDVSISGPATMNNELVTATYTATATWSDSSTSTVTPTWSVNSPMATITDKGVLFFARGVDKDMVVTVSATYSDGAITKTASIDVTVDHQEPYTGTPPWPFTGMSGATYFEEHTGTGGDYESSLYQFYNSTFQQFVYKNPPDASESLSGTWRINGSGELVLDYGGGTTVTVVPVSVPDLGVNLWGLFNDGNGTQYTVRWENCGAGAYPFRADLHGTYVNQYGDTWTFNSDGTGSTTGDGGWEFTWSITDGRLRVVFPNGYVGWMYERPSSRPSMDESIIRWAFLILTNTGEFGAYYGGMALVPD
jgi:hypothetical protein